MQIGTAERWVTSADLTCKTCGMVGCDCDKPQSKRDPMADVCPACRRSKLIPGACQCASHVLHMPSRRGDDEETPSQLPGIMKPSERIEFTVRHVMRCYYDTRDPAEIERVVRELATKAYIA